MKRYLPFLLIGAVLGAAIIAFVALSGRSPAGSGRQQPPADLATRPLTVGDAPRAPVPGASPPHDTWQSGSSVTLEEFGDYQCPPCGALHEEMKKLNPSYRQRVRLIFRNFPLPTLHANAVDAARAAEAAGLQNRFWEMHDRLYDEQKKWEKDPNARQIFTDYARSLGLDVGRFTHDLDSMQVNTRIQQDVNRGQSLGVGGTPTIYLNGRELKLAAPGDLQKALDLALQSQTR
ncbi:MAG TPA: thioredoxin domain-containing protein [Pyrinomonadaceae bacterium]|jgi:protein-disulfide isomerase|nr:thioredoxin domain-containing protein [Pyrinomonadaceae bacterium]